MLYAAWCWACINIFCYHCLNVTYISRSFRFFLTDSQSNLCCCLHSVDGRERDFRQGERWSDENVFANRAYFIPEKQPAELGIDHIRETDQAIYRCRVDFKIAQTRNSKVNLTVIGKFASFYQQFFKTGWIIMERTIQQNEKNKKLVIRNLNQVYFSKIFMKKDYNFLIESYLPFTFYSGILCILICFRFQQSISK